jgi:hypothetical protein
MRTAGRRHSLIVVESLLEWEQVQPSSFGLAPIQGKESGRRLTFLQFGFDTNGPPEVRIGYTELICNDFNLLDACNFIRRITSLYHIVISIYPPHYNSLAISNIA